MEVCSRNEHVIDKISVARNLDDLNAIIDDIREPFGLENIVYHALCIPQSDVSNPMLLLTYDPEWVRRYTEGNYFSHDPVVQIGRRGFLPLDWSQVDRETSDAQQFFAEADKFGVGRQGVTMPIRGPGGERALFTVTSNASETEWKSKRLVYMREFQLIAHFIHDRAIVLSGLRSNEPQRRLSRREKECLQGIIVGKTPKRIAGELNLSTCAIQLYLRSAKYKLGCKSVSEAAVKVVNLELLDT